MKRVKNQDSSQQNKISSTDSTKTNKYILVPSKLFLEQFDKLSSKSQNILEQKLLILKINPHRNKRIHGVKLFLFRIRFEDNGKEKRVIYLLDSPNIKILFILDRNNNYKDLDEYLERTLH